MKKTLIMIAALLAGLFALIGCETVDKDAENTERQTTESSVIDECVAAEYVADDLDTFIQEWVQPELAAGENQVNGNGAASASILLPELQTDEFRFLGVEVREDFFRFYYHPTDPTKLIFPDERYFDDSVGISVVVSRYEGMFEEATTELSPENGVAYDPEINRWYIDNDGILVRVRFPESIQLTDASEIANYFTFEEYGSSDGDSATE